MLKFPDIYPFLSRMILLRTFPRTRTMLSAYFKTRGLKISFPRRSTIEAIPTAMLVATAQSTNMNCLVL